MHARRVIETMRATVSSGNVSGFAAALLFLGGSLVAPASATAQTCMEDVFVANGGNGLNCVSNDVDIARAFVADPANDVIDGCDGTLDDTATFVLSVELALNATERYDIGVYIAEDGGDALNGTCMIDILPTGPSPFMDFDNDMCGDMNSANTPLTTTLGTVTVPCIDEDGNGFLDVGGCLSWRQNTKDVCNSENDAFPGSPSKCNCEILQVTEVPVPCAGVVCDDGNVCNGEEVCDPNTNQCVDGTPLTCDDGTFCNGAETCDPEQGCVAGEAPTCDDGVSCTVDTCDPELDQCVNGPDDSACNDGQFCNGVETCDPNQDCQAGEAPNCDDGVSCTVDTCDETNDQCVNGPNDAACNDGQFCNGVETCDPNQDCQAGEAPNCDDGVSCTVDSCDEGSDQCVNGPDDSVCNDGQFCNGVETCDPNLDCQAGEAPNCDDGVSCTVDSCDEGSDQCVNGPDDSVCNDGSVCNGVETCDPQNDCQAGEAPNCDDANACTADSCSEDAGGCVNDDISDQCDDGSVCTGTETCDPDLGCQPGEALVCEDGFSCTVETCDPEAGCASTPSDELCDDQFTCTDQVCDPENSGEEPGEGSSGCVITPVNENCSDGVVCTDDVCDPEASGQEPGEESDGCVSTPNDGNCDDGVVCTDNVCDPVNDCQTTPVDDRCNNGEFCDGVEFCDPTADCQPGTPPNCDDGVSCTLDACDEAGDTCVNNPSDSICNDGEFCNGVETCDPTNDCQAGAPPECGDEFACTDDSCDETNDACVNEPNDGNCSDGVVCTDDTCDPTADGAGEDGCVVTPNHENCDNGLFCDGEEFCDPESDCQVVIVDCFDPFSCTDDSCDEENDRCVNEPNDENCNDDEVCTDDRCEPEVGDPSSGCVNEPVDVVDAFAAGDARAFGFSAKLLGSDVSMPQPDTNDTNPYQIAQIPLAPAAEVDLISGSETETIVPGVSADTSATAQTAEARVLDQGAGDWLVTATSVEVRSTSGADQSGVRSSSHCRLEGVVVSPAGQPVQDIGLVTEPTEIEIVDPILNTVTTIHLCEKIESGAAAGEPQPTEVGPSTGTFTTSLAINGIHVTVLPGALEPATGDPVTDIVVAHAESAAAFGLVCEVGPLVSGEAFVVSIDADESVVDTTNQLVDNKVARVLLPSTGGAEDATAAHVGPITDGTATLVESNAAFSHTEGSIDADANTASSASHAQVEDLDALDPGTGAVLTADLVRAECTASADGTGVTSSGKTTLTSLAIGGTDIPAEICAGSGDPTICMPAPNTDIFPMGSGGPVLIRLNEQVDNSTAEKADLTVNAIHVFILGEGNPFSLPVGAEIIVSSAHCDAAATPGEIVDGGPFAD